MTFDRAKATSALLVEGYDLAPGDVRPLGGSRFEVPVVGRMNRKPYGTRVVVAGAKRWTVERKTAEPRDVGQDPLAPAAGDLGPLFGGRE